MKRKIRLLIALLTTGILLITYGSQMIYAADEPDSTEVTEIGLTSSSVSMTYEDEYGNYIPTDNFTVTIPKTLSINPKEDYVYDINVKGTIDADRDVWVCPMDSVILTLTDESLADKYGITTTQTLKNTINKLQYSSEEITGAEGYTQQGVIHKPSLDYEIEAEYTGNMYFFINVINENNVIPSSITQNAYLPHSQEVYKYILKKHLPDEGYTILESSIESAINNFLEYSSSQYSSTYMLTTIEITEDSGFKEYEFYFYETAWITKSTVTKGSTVTNGKYYYTYTTDAPTSNQSTFVIRFKQNKSDNTWRIDISGQTSKRISSPIITTDNLSVDLYLSPRCKLVLE